MSPLVQICVVVATLAVVAIAVATVRVMFRLEKATDQVSKLATDIRQWLVQANELTQEARGVLVSAHGVVDPIRRVMERIEILGERATDLAAAVLGEVEPPVRTAVAMARGVRAGTAFFLERLSHRFVHGRAATNGGLDHE